MGKPKTASSGSAPPPIEVGGTTVPAGKRRRLDIPVARLPTQTLLSLPVTVVHGLRSGPSLWVSAAIHGDEINGVEIIRRVLEKVTARKLAGTLIAVPIVNVFGFIEQSRYLPDRRDLNRSFPGSLRGSLAARLAHLFMTEIVARASYGIDLHTASDHRVNLPQIRANLDDAETARIADAFCAPLMLHSAERDGSLRQIAAKQGIPVLLYEAGEALRFGEEPIETGVIGVQRVMAALGMLDHPPPLAKTKSLLARKSRWVRAPRSGILLLRINLGMRVSKGQTIASLVDAFGEEHLEVRSPVAGIVICHTNNPLVHRGDAIVHVASVDAP